MGTWGGFGVIVLGLGGTWGYFRDTEGGLWETEGCFE